MKRFLSKPKDFTYDELRRLLAGLGYQEAFREEVDMIAEKFSMSFSTTLEFIIAFGWFILLIGYLALFFWICFIKDKPLLNLGAL